MKRIPPEVLAWVEIQLGGSIDAVQRLPRASASELIGLTVDGVQVVLRWYADPLGAARDPEAIAREATVLQRLADGGIGTGIPSPRLLASSETDPSVVLMTRVPGRVQLVLPDPGAVHAMLDAIHAVEPGSMTTWVYRGYHEGLALARPAWWQDHALWERAVRQTETARPTAPGVLIHRDVHPGNLLWTETFVTGIVDWVDACVGPAAVDDAHLRVNLACLDGREAADAFDPGDPAWDIEAALGLLDWASPDAVDRWVGRWAHVSAPVARERFEGFVADALARLG